MHHLEIKDNILYTRILYFIIYSFLYFIFATERELEKRSLLMIERIAYCVSLYIVNNFDNGHVDQKASTFFSQQ